MSDAPILVVHPSAPVRTKLAAALEGIGAPTALAVDTNDALHYLSRNAVPSSFVVSSRLGNDSGIALVRGLATLKRTQQAPTVLVLEDASALEAAQTEGIPQHVVPIPRFSNLESLITSVMSAYERAETSPATGGSDEPLGDEETFAEMDRALECFQNVLGMIATNKLPGPMMPKTLEVVRQLKSDPDADFRAVSALVEKQPALSVKVLRMANSAFYSGSVATTTVNQALSRLGLTKALALLEAVAMKEFVVGNDPGLTNFIAENLRQAYAVAVVAQMMAKHHGLDPNDAYTLGLFHNIGPTFFGYTLALLESKKKISAPDVAAVQTVAARKCADLGQAVGEAMLLPDEIGQVFAVGDPLGGAPNPAVALTHQAMWIAKKIGHGAKRIEGDPDSDLLGIDDQQFALINEKLPDILGLLSEFAS